MDEPWRIEIDRLQGRVRRLQAALLVLGAIVIGGVGIAAVAPPGILRTKGIIITDAAGRERILIGAPVPESEDRVRKDARTASLVFVDGAGHDRVVVGESPAPYVSGKSGRRIAEAHGLVFYDPMGSERGGIGFLSNGRAVMALDYPDRDAVGMMADDKSGFAGLLVAHRSPSQAAAIVMGVKDKVPSITVGDVAGTDRAKLEVGGPAAPAWSMRPATTPSPR